MPNELWSLKPGDVVEVREYIRDGRTYRRTPWRMGRVTRVTPRRTLEVASQDNLTATEVTRPDCVRLWKPPEGPDSIERYLNG